MSRADFRPFVPAPGQSPMAGETPRAHAEARLQRPRAQELFATWAKLAAQPYTGITTDGVVKSGLFTLAAEGAPTEAMIIATTRLNLLLTPEQRAAMCFPARSETWRNWQNTELYVEQHGLRLDEVSAEVQKAVMAVLQAGLSTKGYEISRNVMRLNRFLGDLVGNPSVLGEWSYTFCLFGTPSTSDPWGWQVFGHHLSLNCLVIGQQMVLSPCFLGAEPAFADAGPFAGISVFEDEERAGLDLMRSLTAGQQRRAIVCDQMMGDGLPPGRWHFADHLHLGGAPRAPRIVPLEGLPAKELSAMQQRNLVNLVGAYLAPLPPGPLAARLGDFERHMSETHFCWIGGFDEASPFYYRVQSPVVFIEFDHHSGVFLTNKEPAKFHVHTIVRTPNGNDYGFDLLRQHYAEAHGEDGKD